MPEKDFTRRQARGFVTDVKGEDTSRSCGALGLSDSIIRRAKHEQKYHGDIEGGVCEIMDVHRN